MKYFPGALALVLFLALFSFISPATAQDSQQLSFNPESSTITIDGTSNRDDWTVTAPQFEGFVTVNENSGGDTPEIEDASLVINAQEMTGGRSSIMDRLMHGALKAREYPTIEYSLNSVSTEPNGDTFNLVTTGDLTLGGVTQPIEVLLEGSRQGNGAYQFEGSHTINMREFEIDPPTAMFGALVTGNDVIVNFDLLAEN